MQTGLSKFLVYDMRINLPQLLPQHPKLPGFIHRGAQAN
jgi:hypothetical protein